MRTLIIAWVSAIALLSACSAPAEAPADSPTSDSTVSLSGRSSAPMSLSSTAFAHEGTIPVRYTCDGENISPPLSISGVPAHAKSLALVMEDPDVPLDRRPNGLFVHWILANLAPTTATIPMAANPAEIGTPGANTAGNPTYAGPCPPDREHRYFFYLYALDTRLDLSTAPTKDGIEKAMEGHIIAQTTLMGRYDRAR